MSCLADLCQYLVLQTKLWLIKSADVQPERVHSSECGPVVLTADQGVGS